MICSPISLSILSLFFWCEQSFLFFDNEQSLGLILLRTSPWGLCRPREDGAIVRWDMTITDQWSIQLRGTGHCSSCVVIFSSEVFQCTGGKKSLFSKRLKILDLM